MVVIVLGLAVLVILALSMSESADTQQEVIIIRTKPQRSGCGPMSFFFLGVFVCLIVILLLTTD